MSEYQPKNNIFSLFINRNKTEAWHADYTNSALIENEDYFVDLWVKKTKNGDDYYLIKIRKKSNMPVKADPFPSNNDPLDDNSVIPF